MVWTEGLSLLTGRLWRRKSERTTLDTKRFTHRNLNRGADVHRAGSKRKKSPPFAGKTLRGQTGQEAIRLVNYVQAAENAAHEELRELVSLLMKSDSCIRRRIWFEKKDDGGKRKNTGHIEKKDGIGINITDQRKRGKSIY